MFRTFFSFPAGASSIPDLLRYRGNIDASSNPNYPAGVIGNTYNISVAGKIGGASGIDVTVGDLIIAIEDNAGGTQAAVGSDWVIQEGNLGYTPLNAALNLSDVASISSSRTNLGLGSLATVSNLTGAVTSIGAATSLGSFSSANLASALTDETGSGVVVFATSPALTSPALGTPQSGILTNCTGLTEAGQTLADNTTLDVSTSKHGYTPKAPNDTTKFLRGDATWAVPAGYPSAYIEDQKSAGTNGGTFSSGAWRTRDLNTIVYNDSSIVSLSSNQITLAAGTYEIDASAPACQSTASSVAKAKLYNITDSADALIGTTGAIGLTAVGQSDVRSFIRGRITIAGSKVFEVQHQMSNTMTTTGFGTPSGFSVIEVYTQIKITKIA